MPAVPLIALAVTIAGTVSSMQAQRAARGDQKKAAEAQGAMQAEKQAQDVRSQIRQERIRRAQILQASENTGVSESSGSTGATGSLNTQLSSNFGAINANEQHVNDISGSLQSAANNMSHAQTASQISQMGMSIFSASGGFTGIMNTNFSDPAAHPKWGGSYSGFNNPNNYG